jgi:hypothetical protein
VICLPGFIAAALSLVFIMYLRTILYSAKVRSPSHKTTPPPANGGNREALAQPPTAYGTWFDDVAAVAAGDAWWRTWFEQGGVSPHRRRWGIPRGSLIPFLASQVGHEIDHPRLDYLAAKIKSGAVAFLREEYKYLSYFVFSLGVALLILFTLYNSRVRSPARRPPLTSALPAPVLPTPSLYEPQSDSVHGCTQPHSAAGRLRFSGRRAHVGSLLTCA